MDIRLIAMDLDGTALLPDHASFSRRMEWTGAAISASSWAVTAAASRYSSIANPLYAIVMPPRSHLLRPAYHIRRGLSISRPPPGRAGGAGKGEKTVILDAAKNLFDRSAATPGRRLDTLCLAPLAATLE